MTTLTTDAKARKATPIYSGFVKYFPMAMACVAECSKAGNDQHNPGSELHWDRAKSGDELDALQRHLMEAGTFDVDGIRHSAKVAWRAMANLEKEIERDKAAAAAAEAAAVAVLKDTMTADTQSSYAEDRSKVMIDRMNSRKERAKLTEFVDEPTMYEAHEELDEEEKNDATEAIRPGRIQPSQELTYTYKGGGRYPLNTDDNLAVLDPGRSFVGGMYIDGGPK